MGVRSSPSHPHVITFGCFRKSIVGVRQLQGAEFCIDLKKPVVSKKYPRAHSATNKGAIIRKLHFFGSNNVVNFTRYCGFWTGKTVVVNFNAANYGSSLEDIGFSQKC